MIYGPEYMNSDKSRLFSPEIPVLPLYTVVLQLMLSSNH
jgi:hypothetical protein